MAEVAGAEILHLLLHRGEQVAEIAFHLGPVDVLKPRLHTHGPDGIPARRNRFFFVPMASTGSSSTSLHTPSTICS